MSHETSVPESFGQRPRGESKRLGRRREVELLDEKPLGPREAFLSAYERMRGLAALTRRPAVVAIAVAPDGRVLEATLVEDGHALVVGRHPRCGLRLSSPKVALRQLVVFARREAGAMISRVWDLDTGVPFVTEDGQRNAAVIADGPLHVTVHGFGIWLIPAALCAGWGACGREAWSTLPPRVFVDRRSPGQGRGVIQEGLACASSVGTARSHEEVSHVTGVGPALALGEPDNVEIGWGSLVLTHRGRRMRHEVSLERLERGVLVGRYERCGLEIKAEPEISRVHGLLVKIGGEVWAIDAASTNGLWRADGPVKAAPLRDDDLLRLGRTVTLGWTRRLLPEA
ncbi:FHA domain-containing protein [Chondromyces crocatus]|uniref:FHA domain-containing protein n=1 Tax=Chondromyces crocatus TaxID=52 RepID=A0A0K1EE19_CHOCO|nr:FHA domain-containing protein [Chondromyces crocatus]AKT39110.1 uncharacterized protein CMC5_032570 [Chondromyces crocatus]